MQLKTTTASICTHIRRHGLLLSCVDSSARAAWRLEQNSLKRPLQQNLRCHETPFEKRSPYSWAKTSHTKSPIGAYLLSIQESATSKRSTRLDVSWNHPQFSGVN